MQFLNDFLNIDRPRTSSIIDKDSEAIVEMDNEDSSGVQTSSVRCDENQGAEPTKNISNTFTKATPTTSKVKNRSNHTQQESASSTLMKYILQKKDQDQAIHPIDHFFSLMASTVKNFSPLDQHMVKTKIFTMVSQIEEKYLTDTNFYATNVASPSDFSTPFSQYSYIHQQAPASIGSTSSTPSLTSTIGHSVPDPPRYHTPSPQYQQVDNQSLPNLYQLQSTHKNNNNSNN